MAAHEPGSTYRRHSIHLETVTITMLNKRHKIIKGTIYLRGHQSSFHNSITQALNVRPDESQLTYEITTDLIRSMKNKALVFRVDYRFWRPG
jgi:hypothetical protein